MLKLTTIHIDEMRRYFLAENQEEQLAIINSIRPSYLSNFFPQLKDIFTGTSLDESKLFAVAKAMGAEHLVVELKEIRQIYYSRLAQLYNSGVSNIDIDVLIKSKNIDFLEEVEFQRDIETAFRLKERAILKEEFKLYEKQSDISTEEVNQAFKLIERQKLKEQFQQINFQAEVERRGLVAHQQLSSASFRDKEEVRASVIQFSWRRLAVAASLIGFISSICLYLFSTRENVHFDSIATSEPNETSSIKYSKGIEDLGFTKEYEIKEKKTLLSSKINSRDSVYVEVINIKPLVKRIDLEKSFLSGDSNEVQGSNVNRNNRHFLDSLNVLQEELLSKENTYTYNPEKKIIKLNLSNADSVSDVYRFSVKRIPSIYILINSNFYKITPSKETVFLQHVTNKKVISELRKIQIQ